MFNIINEIDKKYALSFISGLLFGGVTVYASFFYVRKPELKFQLLNKSPIFEIHENIPKLQITLNKHDISKNNEKISMFIVRILNSGDIDITEGHYSTKFPITFSIKNGRLIDIPTAFQFSRKQLMEPFNKKNQIENVIELEKLILNTGDYLLFKLLIIHNEGELPYIEIDGELSGISELKLEDISTPVTPTLFDRIWNDNISIYLLRWFSYSIAFTIISLITLFPITIFFSKLLTNRRKNKINTFFSNRKNQNYAKFHEYFNLYLDIGNEIFTLIKRENSYQSNENIFDFNIPNNLIGKLEFLRKTDYVSTDGKFTPEFQSCIKEFRRFVYA